MDILEFVGFTLEVEHSVTNIYKSPEGQLYTTESLPPLDMNFFVDYVVPKLDYAEITYKYYLNERTYLAKLGMGIFREGYNKDPNKAWQEALLKLMGEG